MAWFSPINAGSRKYRVAQLGLDLPGESNTPLRVKAAQVHSDATKRGTVQHFVLERPGTAINLGPEEELEFFVTCAEEGGNLTEPVPYGLAVSIEVQSGTDLAVYNEVRDRLKLPVPIPARVR